MYGFIKQRHRTGRDTKEWSSGSESRTWGRPGGNKMELMYFMGGVLLIIIFAVVATVTTVASTAAAIAVEEDEEED